MKWRDLPVRKPRPDFTADPEGIMAETILLTGISGFIAKHVALKFLAAGYAVRGTVRRLDRAGEVRAALLPHLEAAARERLSFVAADLEADAG